jgi:hypothetical protein
MPCSGKNCNYCIKAMVVVARDRFQIQQNVVKNVRVWGRFIKTVKRPVSVQGAIIALRANLVKQGVGSEAGKI